MARLEIPLGAGDVLIEPSWKAHIPEGIYEARTLVRDRREVPIRIMNTTICAQTLAKGFSLGSCEPVTLGTPPGATEAQMQETALQLEDVLAAARSNLSNERTKELEELITEYEDIFVTSSDYGQNERLYHRINIGNVRPSRQPPRRLPLAEQAEVGEMLEDMQQRRVIEDCDSSWSSPIVLVR
jgi:hypothetical protein